MAFTHGSSLVCQGAPLLLGWRAEYPDLGKRAGERLKHNDASGPLMPPLNPGAVPSRFPGCWNMIFFQQPMFHLPCGPLDEDWFLTKSLYSSRPPGKEEGKPESWIRTTMAFTNKNRVILGPLTTVFVPPAPCTIAIGQCATCNVAWWGQTCAPTTVQDDTSCWPATTEGTPAPSAALYGWGFYSPGLECPAGYTSACTAIAGHSSQWKVQYQMKAEETFVGCCPTGFNCDNLNGQTCIMRAKSLTLATVSCESGSSNNFGFTTLPNAHVTSLSLFAPMIQLAFQSSDLSRSSITTSSSSSTTTSTTSALPSSIPTTTPSSSSDSAPQLSTGAIAGIAAGSAALIVLVLAAAFFVWRRRRQQQYPPDHGPNPSSYDPSEYSDTKEFTHYYTGNTAELGQGHGMAEAPAGGHERAEMFADQVRVREGAGLAVRPSEYYSETKEFSHYYSGNTAELGQGHERVEAPGDGHERAEMFVNTPRVRESGGLGAGAAAAAPVVRGASPGPYPHSPDKEAVEMPVHNYR